MRPVRGDARRQLLLAFAAPVVIGARWHCMLCAAVGAPAAARPGLPTLAAARVRRHASWLPAGKTQSARGRDAAAAAVCLNAAATCRRVPATPSDWRHAAWSLPPSLPQHAGALGSLQHCSDQKLSIRAGCVVKPQMCGKTRRKIVILLPRRGLPRRSRPVKSRYLTL